MSTMNIFDLTDTWNAGATTFTAIKMNVTDTASASGSLLIDLQVGGSSRFKVDKTGIVTAQSAVAGTTGWFQSSVTIGSLTGGDVILARDAANTLAQRNGTNAQAFRVYNTFTDASNYERGRVAWESNVFTVGAQNAGTGTFRTTYLTSSGASSSAQVRIGTDASGGRIWFTPANTNAWEMNSSGHFLAGTDNTYDIGAAAATRPRNVYVAGVAAVDGVVGAKFATATTAGGVQAIQTGTTSALGLYYGSGAPTVSAARGSVYLRSDGTPSVNTNGSTTWEPLGYLGVPQNSQSAAYTLVIEDAGKHILHPSADTTARTFTIPANGSVTFPVGTVVTFVNQNAGGVITIAITTDTMRLAGAGTTGSRTLAANGIATAIKVTSTEWLISGTGLT